MRNRQQLLTVQALPVDRPIVQYVRQSTRKQVKHNRVSTEMQDSDMRNILIQHGWKPELILEAIADDTGKSGTKRKDQRKGLQRLYSLVESGKVGAIAAYNVSRIYRTLSMAETGAFCDLVMERGIPIITKRRVYWPTRDDNKDLQRDFQAAADYIEDVILGTVVAARDYNVAENGAYGGNGLPIGFQIVEDENEIKRYAEYTPHADLVCWLFKRYRALGGNMPLLGRELEHGNFRFPPLAPGIFAPLKLRQDEDGWYPLRNRVALVNILTNKAYIGIYEYGETRIENAHDALVPLDDFLFAYERLSPVDLSGNEQTKRPYERRYGGATALLDGIVTSGNGRTPVYVLNGRYTTQERNNGWIARGLRVDVSDIDSALEPALIAILASITPEERAELHAQIEDIRKGEAKQAEDFAGTLARIDQEINNALMAQRVSRNLGDEHGYTEATKQLIQLRKDRAAVEVKEKQAGSKASDLEECHDLLECAARDWFSWKPEKRKRLVRMLILAADISAPSPHFIRLQCFFGTPLNRVLSMLIYRKHGHKFTWTDDSLSTLHRLFTSATREQLMRALPDCTWGAINNKAMDEGLSGARGVQNELPLTYSDRLFMAESGAMVDEVVWRLDGYMVDEQNRVIALVEEPETVMQELRMVRESGGAVQ